MDATAGVIIVSSVMLSCSTLVAAGLLWLSARLAGHSGIADRQKRMGTELAEISADVKAIRALLEDSID
ncbi:hypothetical protein [Streptomyces sp. DH10]|uniref:hypothetical protein n=1 Tax=Streptomyces sp. DH10 TaxID=3040121 RepID=UPI002440FAAD|nr:hypothetical protein [Streptomyces sp. DH10]MDG9711947.1 hypothetical protein [Streptomyces sp. DH10]